MDHLPERYISLFFFFFNDTATTEIYTLSLHDALPASPSGPPRPGRSPRNPACPYRRRGRRRDRGRGTRPGPGSQHQAVLLQEGLDRPEEVRSRRAVQRAVVAGQRQGHQRTGLEARLRGHGFGLDCPDREDRRLRRVEDGNEPLDAEHAEVRDREGAAVEIFLAELARARACDDVCPGCGQLGDRQALGLVDHGDDEAGVDRDRDADVGARMELDRVFGPQRVDRAVAHQRGGAGLGQDVRDGGPGLAFPRLLREAVMEALRAGHVGRHRDLERRRLPRLGQPACDRAAERRQRNAFDLTGRCGRGYGRRRRRRRGHGGTLDVLGDDAALGAGALEGAELDPALAGDPAGQRRGLDPRAGSVALRRLTYLVDLLGRCCLAATFALWLARGARRTFLLRCFSHRLRGLADDARDVFALFADDGDRGANVGFALGDGDLEQDAGGLSLDLLRHLVRIELVERLALFDLVALGLQPLDDRPGLHPLAQAGELDLVSHASSQPFQGQSPSGDCPYRRYESRCTVLWIASSTSLLCGTTYSSITGAKGSGANFAPTRSTGASSQSKAWCCTTAATSAPKPIRVTASWATTQRFVFFTEATIASSSSGCSVRGSTTSTETPCCSASSAAASASCTSLPVATTVTSSPSR